MSLSKGIIEEITDYCNKNFTHVPNEVDAKMAELYKKYHKSAFRTIEKALELQGVRDKLDEVRGRELENLTEFFNYVMEVPNRDSGVAING